MDSTRFFDSWPVRRGQELPGQPRLSLVGRQTDLEAVRQGLLSGAPVMVIGRSGLGKTALAHALASQYVEQPGGVLWLESADETALALANRVARAYGATPCASRDEEEVAAFFRLVHGLLVEQRPLVVLDGRVRPEAAREFVRACAPGIPLIVTQNRPAAGPWLPHEISPLEARAALSLLEQLAGRSVEPADETMRLVEVLEGNALSLTMAGLQLAAGHDANEFLAQMPELPPGPTNRVMAALMAAYRLLPHDLQGMVMLIGTTFAGGASAELLSDVTGAPPDNLVTRMGQLVERGFATGQTLHGQPYYVAHELVQRFAQAFLRGKHRLDTMRARHLHAIPVYVRRYVGERSPEDYARLALEMPNVIAAGRFAATQGKREYLRELIEMLAPVDEQSFVRAAGFVPEYEWLCHVLEVPEADTLGLLGWAAMPKPESAAETPALPPAEEPAPPASEVAATGETGHEEVALAEPPAIEPPPTGETPQEAASQEPVSSAPSDMPEERVMPSASEPGAVEADVPETPPATASPYAQAAESFKADGDVGDELAALEALAMMSLEGERYEDVLAYIDQGMKLAHETDNPQREGELLVLLGDLQVALERWKGAEEAYKQAIVAFRPAGAWLNIGLALDKLGSVYWETGRSQEAAEAWEQAVPLFERVSRTDLIREVLRKVADTRAELLQWDSARAAGERLLALARAEGDRAGECEQLLSLGALRESQGDREGALQYYRAALHVSFSLAGSDWQGQALLALARLLIDDTVHLNRTLQLLEAAENLLPNDTEVQRLLKRAKTRQERLIRGGVTLPVASSSLQAYARQAYEELRP